MISGMGAERGSVPKKKIFPRLAALMDSISSLMSLAVAAAVDAGRKSSHGFAREITEVAMEWVFINESLASMEE